MKPAGRCCYSGCRNSLPSDASDGFHYCVAHSVRGVRILQAAESSHEACRDWWCRQNANGVRMAKTSDADWVSLRGISEFDVARMDYSDLPDDWKKEYRCGAEFAIEALIDVMASTYKDIIGEMKSGNRSLTEVFIDEAANLVHMKWVECSKVWAVDGFNIPFEDLTEEKKEFSRIFVRQALAASGNPVRRKSDS